MEAADVRMNGKPVMTSSDPRLDTVYLKCIIAYDPRHEQNKLGKVHQVILLLTLHC